MFAHFVEYGRIRPYSANHFFIRLALNRKPSQKYLVSSAFQFKAPLTSYRSPSAEYSRVSRCKYLQRYISSIVGVALASFVPRAFIVWLLFLQARLSRFVVGALRFCTFANPRARCCKRVARRNNSKLTRRCTRPPTALRFARKLASLRASGGG